MFLLLAANVIDTEGPTLSRWIFALVQFVPLSFFASFAYWNGSPDRERWMLAYEYAAVAAVVQLLIVLPQRRPANRLILGASLYLIVGGLAAITQQIWLLRIYRDFQESAIFGCILFVGILTTLWSPVGYVGAATIDRATTELATIRRSSIILLVATLLALGCSVLFRGNRQRAAVWPIVGLAIVQRVLASRTR